MSHTQEVYRRLAAKYQREGLHGLADHYRALAGER